MSPARLIGNLAALIGIILLVALFVDAVAGWSGYQTHSFCTALLPVTAFASQIGVVLTTIGVIVWAVSMGKSQAGISLALGGILLFVMPLTLPHYLGISCLP